MSRHRNKNRIEKFAQDPKEEVTEQTVEKQEAASPEEAPETEEKAEEKPAEETAESLLEKEKEKVEAEKKKYVYLMAEFDNYRRRVSQEKLDLIDTASKGQVAGMLLAILIVEKLF